MYRSLYFKIILIFVVFMITVMAVVGTVLLNSVFTFYNHDFVEQLDSQLAVGTQLRSELVGVMKKLVKADHIHTEVVDLTPLGIMEIVRQKVRKPLEEELGLC